MKNLFFLILLLAVPSCGAGESTNLLSRLEPVPPFPALAAAAKTEGIPMEPLAPCAGTNGLAIGDSVTALFTLHQRGNRLTQWLVYFQVVASHAVKSAGPAKPFALYSSTGRKFEFTPSQATFRIRSLGPYVNSSSIWGEPTVREKSVLVPVNKGFLSLGLEKGAAAIYRVNLAKEKTGATNFDVWVTAKPPAPKDAAENQKEAALLHITPEEERDMVAWYPALFSYFSSVGQTPNLEGIMWKVINLPSVWSMVRHAGITASIGIGLSEVAPISLPPQWHLPAQADVYTLPMAVTLNGQPAITATLLVTDPRPPLTGCGGIVGFLAENPVDHENYLTLQVISARSGGGPAEKK